jgi:hypothetical protein
MKSQRSIERRLNEHGNEGHPPVWISTEKPAWLFGFVPWEVQLMLVTEAVGGGIRVSLLSSVMRFDSNDAVASNEDRCSAKALQYPAASCSTWEP